MRTLLLLLMVTGCASGPRAVRPDKYVTAGAFKLLRERWEADQKTVLARAPIDLGCTEPIEVTPLDNFGGELYVASQVMARGCEQVAIYTRVDMRLGLSLNNVRREGR